MRRYPTLYFHTYRDGDRDLDSWRWRGSDSDLVAPETHPDRTESYAPKSKSPKPNAAPSALSAIAAAKLRTRMGQP